MTDLENINQPARLQFGKLSITVTSHFAPSGPTLDELLVQLIERDVKNHHEK